MGINVIDTATSQRNLNFPAAFAEGWRACYVKLGGDNVGRYVAPWYVSEVDRARAAGFRIGHYWVPNANYDPTGAADYFVDHLRGWTAADFVVLDNESLDGAHLYSDAQAAVWVERVKQRLSISGSQVDVYYGLAEARGRSHDAVLATGANFIIAAYSYPPMQFPIPATIPAARIVGHQYGGSTVGGVVCDTNLFTDNAFDYAATPAARRKGKTMYLARDVNSGTIWLYTDNGRAGIAGMWIVNLFQRLLYGATPYDGFNAAELDAMQSVILAAGNSGSEAEMTELLKAVNSIEVTVDAAAVAQSIIDAINEQGVEVDMEALAAAVDAALADNFAAIPKAVTDEIAS